jgi:hypothetical protein
MIIYNYFLEFERIQTDDWERLFIRFT